MKKKPKYLNAAHVKKSSHFSKSTIVLGYIALILLLLVIVLIFVRPDNDQVIETVPTDAPETTETTEATQASTVPPETEPVMLENMAALYALNPDTIGWIRIDDTELDYPVMYTPDDEEKYLRADFEGNWNSSGLPFIEADCSMDPESDNLIIYGHNMRNGTAFRTLISYDDEEFWEEHPTFFFSTLYEERTYEIVSVFYDRVYKKTDTCFKFYKFIDPETEEEFNEAINYYQRNALYDTGVTAEYGDHLITLVTCSYHTTNGRFVVIGREVTEDPEVTKTTQATELPEVTQ